jgi:putative toxin-antitoxin system antitoxin component (TIGR02293 family)
MARARDRARREEGEDATAAAAGRDDAGASGLPAVLDLLGVRAADAAQLLARVERGFPFAALERFKRASELSWEEIAAVVQVPVRTLTRRRGEGRLQPAESDRLLRAARVFQLVLDLFEGDRAAARRWLAGPQRALGGRTPLEFVRTETGAREVERLVGRLEHGVFA